MKKLIIGLMITMLCATAYAGQGRVQRVFNDQTIETTNTITSRTFRVDSSGYFGAWLDMDTAIGTSEIDISCQMSYVDTASKFATPTSMSLVQDDLSTTDPIVVSLAPAPMKYMRFVAQGTGSNTTGTTLTMYMFNQDE